jgi:hypothetical protein
MLRILKKLCEDTNGGNQKPKIEEGQTIQWPTGRCKILTGFNEGKNETVRENNPISYVRCYK